MPSASPDRSGRRVEVCCPMKTPLSVGRTWALTLHLLILLCCLGRLNAQHDAPSPEPKSQSLETSQAKRQADNSNSSGSPIEILSDTMGVNFHPYLQKVLHDVRQNWYGLIPEVARPPESRKGRLSIEFAILRNGDIKDLKLVESSGDVQLDRAAWDGITASSPLPPLPMEFGGSSLSLRFRFFYNSDKSPVTGRIQSSKSIVAVSISPPDSLEVPIGGSGIVIVTVMGTTNKAVTWRITGLGCSRSACGKMLGDLYIAPQALPRPASVTLTAIAEADPTASASIAVNLVAAKSTK